MEDGRWQMADGRWSREAGANGKSGPGMCGRGFAQAAQTFMDSLAKYAGKGLLAGASFRVFGVFRGYAQGE
jgi:hypothetical protein